MLVTKNICLDTSVIIANNFDYSNPTLQVLERLAREGHARLVTTSIIVSEVESNIKERVRTARREFERTQKENPILRHLTTAKLNPFASVFHEDAAAAELIRQFHEFLTRTNTETLALGNTSTAAVFDRYFSQQPPFGDGKKKHEFPDAFTLSILEGWCTGNQQKLYVVSTDPDLTRFCETSGYLIPLKRSSEFSDLHLRQIELMRTIEDSVSANLAKLEAEIEPRFEYLGFYLDDEEGEVDEVQVQRTEIDMMSLLDFADGIARFEASTRIKYSAAVTYDDYQTAVWDSEEKTSIPLRQINAWVDREADMNIIFSIRADANGAFQSVTNVAFEATDVPVSANEYDDPR
jgi:PIN domain